MHPAAHGHGHSRSGLNEKDAGVKANRRRSIMRSDSSHSRQSSRSSTPTAAEFNVDGAGEKALSEEKVRRGSSVSSTASARRKRADLKSGLAMTSQTGTTGGNGDRPRRKKERPRTPESDDGTGTVTVKKEEDVDEKVFI
jgi:hypothetical protein